MAAAKDIDPTFQQGAGKKAGLEVWQTSNGRCFLQPSQRHGTFYTDQSYVILQTRALQCGGLQHNIHYWFGRSASQRDAAVAAFKSVELKAYLQLSGGGGGARACAAAVIAREVEGYESDKFLSYFKPTCSCIIPIRPLEPGTSSAASSRDQRRRLFLCRGRRAARVTEVPFVRSSLSHDHVFVVDTENKIFQFNGANADVYERTKALDVVRCLKENFHNGRSSCHVAIIDDGPVVDDIDKREFWSMFGGYSPVLRRITYDEDDNYAASTSSGTLYSLSEGCAVRTQSSPLRREMLSGYACYMLDCGKELFVWLSHGISQAEQKTAILLAEEWSAQYKNPWSIKLVCVVEGHEPVEFRSKFHSWPLIKPFQSPQLKMGKVAVLLKQTGFNIKELLRRAPPKQKPLQHCKPKKIQVWCVNGRSSRECLPSKKQGKLYGNNCYIVYVSNENRENILFLWLGRQSTLETRASIAYHANDVAKSMQENLVEVYITQGKEPAQFLSLFDKLFLIKDEERKDDVALFQVQQSDASKWHAVQVTLAATSLNSSSCFFLQTGSIFYAWYGKFTTGDEQEATRNMVYNLKPDALLTSLKEGYETQAFWSRLGGRQTYPNHLEPKQTTKEPRLLSCTVSKDRVKTTEIFNFTQDDLLSDEIMILDSHTSIFIWVGHAANPQHKMKALEFGQKYLEQAAKYEGISADIPIYIIKERWEPHLFTSFFSWDPAKPKEYHDIFERKALSLTAGEPVKQKETVTASRNNSILERKNFPPIQKSTSANVQVSMLKPENSMQTRYRETKPNAGFLDASSRSIAKPAAVMLEFHTGRQAPPNTPIVRTTLPYVRPIKECSPIKEGSPSSPTSSTSLSPGIATLTSVFESYQDRCSFAWPGMSTRYEERAHRELESYSYERILEDDEETFISFDEKTLKESKEERQHPYERLKVSSPNPVQGIDTWKRESYLSDQEFMQIFNMDREAFYKLPRWKQEKSKKLNDLF